MGVHIFTGTAAPATTPQEVGDHFVDTNNDKHYISVGTASSADWQLQQGGQQVGNVEFIINGGLSAISTGIKGDIKFSEACTIVQVELLAYPSGSVVLDLWKDSYANFPPDVSDTITASAKPTISADVKSTDSTLTGWTTSITAGDIIRVNVDSASTITNLTLFMKVLKT